MENEKDRIEELMWQVFMDITEAQPTSKIFYTPNSNYLEFESTTGGQARLQAEYSDTGGIRCFLTITGRTVEQDVSNMKILTDAILKMK